MLCDFGGRSAEQLFEQIGTAGDAEFFRDHAKRILRRDEMYPGHARVGLKSTKQFAAEDGARSSGDGNGEIYGFHVRVSLPRILRRITAVRRLSLSSW